MYVLAIDMGTSGPKVALVSARGEVADYEYEKTRLTLLPGGGAEQAPDEWWEAIRRASRRLLAKGLVAPENIRAVCCTTQWSGTVAVDRDGQALMNAIIWMDARGARYVDAITRGFPSVQGYGLHKLLGWVRLTGGIPGHSGKDPIAHILFIRNELPDVYRRTFKFLEPKDYLNLRLTGKYAASFDSIALHWVTDNRDIDRVVYHPKLLGWSTLEREKLPDLKRAIDVLGPVLPAVADDLGLPRDLPVVMGTPDVQSAAVGSGAVSDFQGHLYIGTSSWLSCHVPFKKTDMVHNMASLPSAIPGRYFIANEQECAGACLNFLKDNLLSWHGSSQVASAPSVEHLVLEELAESSPPGSRGVVFTPWLNGERTPVEDHLIRGGFHNLSLSSQRADLVRAVFEGVACNTRWLLGCVEAFIGRRMDPIRMIGGGAQSDLWCQIHADVLGRSILQVEKPILANARGAGLLGAVGAGLGTFDGIQENVRIARSFAPDPALCALYDDRFGEFLRLYRCNRGIHARLNRPQPIGRTP